MRKILFSCVLLFTSIVSARATSTLVLDQDYLPVLLKTLSTASSRVDVMAFSFAIDEGGKINPKNAAYKVAEKLIELRNRGVKVRLYIEANRDTSDRNRITAQYLENAGITVKYGATHAKGFLIDDKYVLFGSTNLTTQSMIHNNETNVLSDDVEVAHEFSRFYENLWQDGIHGSINLNPPLLADGAYKASLIKLIGEAKQTLEFSIYYFNDHEIEQALIDAHARGVRVVGYINQHKSFGLNLVARNIETVKRLRASGLGEIYFDLNTFFSHSKYLIKDQQEILLGTGNWNHSDVSEHRQLYMHLKSPQTAIELSKHLHQQIEFESDPKM